MLSRGKVDVVIFVKHYKTTTYTRLGRRKKSKIENNDCSVLNKLTKFEFNL